MIHPEKEEIRLQGIGVSPGISYGQADLVGTSIQSPKQRPINRDEVEKERIKLENALALTRSQIADLQAEVEKTIGDENASIFDAHLLLIEDSKVIDEALLKMEQELCSVEWAYFQTISKYVHSFRQLSDAYFRERAIDIEDVGQRVLKNLRWPDGNWKAELNQDASIVLAHDLTPSDTVGFDRDKVKGFATEAGSATSHTAIMAHSLNIPAVVALHSFRNACKPGDIVLVDGFNGLLIINPSKETLAHYQPLIDQINNEESNLLVLKDQETVTADGCRIVLSANLEFIEELDVLTDKGAEGVGLYRTEFFYMSDPQLQTEISQADNYARMAAACGDHGVIIRTLDIGGDKLLPELFEEPEPNPFLGWRGIRLSLDRPEQFKVQLRAILRASAFGKVRLMYPFVSNVGEVIAANRLLEEAKGELREQGVGFDESIEKGAMIEIPSAVFVADHIAKEVDFFSIGTNDLVQYTTAVDRVNDRVANLYRPTHPAVIELMRLTVEAAHRNAIWCGICGEVASDLRLTPLWIGIGIDELSVAPAQVLRIRKAISSLNAKDCKELCDQIRNMGRAREILKFSHNFAGKFYPELLRFPS